MTLACQLGFWSAAATTAIGSIYLAGMIGVAATGSLVLPPPAPVQLFGAVVTLLEAPLLLVMVAAVHRVTPEGRRMLSQLGLVFATLFAAMVSINRYVQLAVVRPGERRGAAGDLARWLPYDPGSAMFALELLGWGLFLGLAALCLAPLYGEGRLERAIRGLLLAYGALGLGCALGHVLPLATALLAVSFRRTARLLRPGGS